MFEFPLCVCVCVRANGTEEATIGANTMAHDGDHTTASHTRARDDEASACLQHRLSPTRGMHLIKSIKFESLREMRCGFREHGVVHGGVVQYMISDYCMGARMRVGAGVWEVSA